MSKYFDTKRWTNVFIGENVIGDMWRSGVQKTRDAQQNSNSRVLRGAASSFIGGKVDQLQQAGTEAQAKGKKVDIGKTLMSGKTTFKKKSKSKTESINLIIN